MDKRAAIYCRVSKDEQAKKGYGLEIQEDACRQEAERRGYEVMQVFRDEGVSGALRGRPAMLELLNYLGTVGNIDVVLSWQVDRLGRKNWVSSALINEIEELGAAVVTVREGDNPLAIDIGGVLAEHDYTGLQEKMKAGAAKKLEETAWIRCGGRPPFGYQKRDEDVGRGKPVSVLVVDLDEAKTVMRIFREYSQGLSLRGVADGLRRDMIPTKGDRLSFEQKGVKPGSWTKKTIRGILMNETYVGRWFYGKTELKYKDVSTGRMYDAPGEDRRKRYIPKPREEWIEKEVPRLIDDDTFAKVQVRLQENVAMAGRRPKREYLLRGRIRCGVCGRAGRAWATKNKVGHYYTCTSRNDEDARTCDLPYFSGPELEDVAIRWLAGLLADEDSFENFLQDVIASEQDKSSGLYVRRDAVENRLQELGEKEKRLVELYSDGNVTRDVYNDAWGKVTDEQRRLAIDLSNVLAELLPVDIKEDDLRQEWADVRADMEIGLTEDAWDKLVTWSGMELEGEAEYWADTFRQDVVDFAPILIERSGLEVRLKMKGKKRLVGLSCRFGRETITL